MRPITGQLPVSIGDVVYNPALGFAAVTGMDAEGLNLAWHQVGERLPRRVSHSAAEKGYQLCDKGGFFFLAVLDNEGLQELQARDPAALLLLLLEELHGPQELLSLGQWLTRVGQVSSADLDAFLLRADVDGDSRFSSHGGRISRNADYEDTEPSLGDVTAPLPSADEELRPWAHLPRLDGLELLHTGMELLGLLAHHHARGKGVGVDEASVWADAEGNLELSLSSGPIANDVHAAGRLLLQRCIGRDLPRGVPPHRLMPFLAGLCAGLPVSAIPLLESLLAPSQTQRPRSAVDAYATWSAAAALEEVRAHALLPTRVRMEVGADTHVGRYKMRDHQTNQDAFMWEEEHGQSLLVVCDGISTSDAGSGDLASRLAVEVFESGWERRPPTDATEKEVAAWLRELLALANTRICESALDAANGDLSGRIPMGTTIVVARTSGASVDMASLGDSRIYLIGSQGAAQLTPDQNVELEWMQGIRDRHQDGELLGQALIGYLGHFDETGAPSLLKPWQRRVRMLSGETLVLMSDGIVDYATPSHLDLLQLMTKLVNEKTPEEAAMGLVTAANRGGGGDNATALIARLSVR